MKEIEIFLSFQVLEILPTIPLRQRRRLIDFFRYLRLQPDERGDFSEFDDTDREIQSKVIGKHVVRFWYDSPEREVKITAILNADIA